MAPLSGAGKALLLHLHPPQEPPPQPQPLPLPTSERLYVGGILPTAGLTVPQVLERVQRQLGDALALSDVHQGSTYCQFTATARCGSTTGTIPTAADPSVPEAGGTTSAAAASSASASSSTPLELLRQHFHNVVWRGCKLKVEQAQPHFLDRLAAERAARQVAIVEPVPAAQHASLQHQDPLPQPNSGRIPRHLTLRRPVPRESSSSATHTRGRNTTTNTMPPPPRVARIKVDTKPRPVADWSDLTRRLRQVRENSKKVVAPPSTDASSTAVKEATVLMAPRALHLRLQVDATNSNDANDEPVEEDDVSDAGMDSIIHGCVSASGSDRASRIDDHHSNSPHAERGAYVWSDDESSDDESNGNDDEPREEMGMQVESDDGTDHRRRHSQTVGGGDDEREDWSHESNHRLGREHSTQHQRASAVADVETDDVEDEECIVREVREDRPSPAHPTDVSLGGDDPHPDDSDALLLSDVASNLRILSQLFPDIPTKPAAVIPSTLHPVDDPITTADPRRSASNKVSAAGWGRTGQMLRYDPKSPAAQAFVLPDALPPPAPETDANGNHAVDSGNRVDDDRATNDKTLDCFANDKTATAPSSVHLYEQHKLEALFREARGEGMTDDDRRMAAASASSSFAFGFPVSSDQGPSNTPGTSAPFSFSFALQDAPTSPAQLEQSTMDGIENFSRGGPGRDEEDHYTEEPRSEAPKRRFGRAFTHEELHSHIAPFLRLGSGWTGSLDQWRHDESLKAQWLKERTTLTQDWKRKRKAAVARKKDRKSY